MGGKRRDRPRPPGRSKEPCRARKPLLLIVCEGENTEPEYLEGLARSCRVALVEIKIHRKHGVPLSLVQFAKAERDRAAKAARMEGDPNLRYDSVWCVPDVDKHPNLPEAKLMAAANGIEIVVSNPCFELWLLLHFQDSPGAKPHRDLLKPLKKHLPKYDKHVDFADFQAGYPQAVKRARRLVETANREHDPGRNPTTDVYRLTEAIAGSDAGSALHPSD